MNSPDSTGRRVILAAVAYVALLGLTTLPVTHILAVSLLPIPFIVMTVARIRYVSIGMAVMAALLLFVMGYGWFAALYGLSTYFMGWSMGEVLRSKRSPHAALVFGAFTVVMLELVGLAMIRHAGVDVYQVLQTSMTDAAKENPAAKEALSDVIPVFIEGVRTLTPGLICVVGVVVAWLNVLGAKAICGPTTFANGLLTRFRLPQSIVLVYVVSVLALLIDWKDTSPFWWQVCNNAVLLSGFFIGIEGISLLWRWSQRFRAKWVLLVGMFIIAPLPIVRSIYVLLGLLDIMNRVKRAR